MKKNVCENIFIQEFEKYGRAEQFSRAGLRALFRHLEELGEATGEEIELDVIALCCEYTEYDTAVEAAEEQGWADYCGADEGEEGYATEEEKERAAIEFLRGDTDVIEIDGGGVIVRAT